MEMRPVAIPATGGATLMDTTDEEASLAKDQAWHGLERRMAAVLFA